MIMANLKLFIAPVIVLWVLWEPAASVGSASEVSCLEQFYKNIVWYDIELDIISKKSHVRNDVKLAEICRALSLLIAQAVQNGCQLSAIQLSELGQRQRHLLEAGATSCWAAGPYRSAVQTTQQPVAKTTPITPSNQNGLFTTTLLPIGQTESSRYIYENINSCDMKVKNCYLRFHVNLMMRSGFRNQTCAIIESFTNCLLELKECDFFELLRPLVVEEAASQVEFRFWESKECLVDIQRPSTDTPSAITSMSPTTSGQSVTYSLNECGRDKLFRCANGNCVHLDHVCNAHDNCGDASDEVNCHDADKKIALQIEQTFVKYGCYDVMENCTSLYITPVLLSVQAGQQLDPQKLCQASRQVFGCAVHDSCPLSAYDRVRVSALLVHSFEQVVSRATCQLITDTFKSSTSSMDTFKATNTPSNINEISTTRNIDTTSIANSITTNDTIISSNTMSSSIATTTSSNNITNSKNITSNCVPSCKGIPSRNYHSCLGCNVYATCVDGVLYDNRSCPAKLLWDDNSKQCEVYSTTCQVTAPKYCVSSCVGLDSGDYQSCTGCNVYLTCTNGIMLDSRPCPKNLVWDDINKRCQQSSITCKSA